MYGIPERKLRDCRDSSYFLRFAKNRTSQGGEDGILCKLFELIGTTSKPYCVDIGAWDGQHLSNTYNLIQELNWGGLLVEANSERYATLCNLYANRPDVTCIDCLVDIDGDNALTTILQNQNAPKDLDFISIDVDGADYHLWHTIGSTYKPRVMCIEFNPTIPNHVHYVQERDIAIQEGSSLLALTELGRSFGYHLVVTTTFNAIFVRHDLMHHLPLNIFTYLPTAGSHKLPINNCHTSISEPSEHSIDRVVDLNSMHNCSMATDIFQTYCGELKLCGPKKLMWHRVSMNIQQMQAIKPKKDRVFPFAPPYSKTINRLEVSMTNIALLLAGVSSWYGHGSGDNDAQSSQLECALTDLLTQCAEVFGISAASSANVDSDTKKSTATLRAICAETMLNTLGMCLVVHRELSAREDNVNNGVLSILCKYLELSVVLFEQIGDQCCDQLVDGGARGGRGSTSNTSTATLDEGKLWYERALYASLISSNMSKSVAARVLSGASSVTATKKLTVARLSRKLSLCSLQSTSQPLAWTHIFRTTSTAPAGTIGSSSTEDIDGVLRGLFWKQLADGREACKEGDAAVAAATAGDEETQQLQKLNAKWRSKALWAECAATQPALLAELLDADKGTPALAPSAHPSRPVALMDALGALLDSCWSPLRYQSSDSLGGSLDLAAGRGSTALLARVLELETVQASNSTDPVKIGLGFVFGCIVGGCVVNYVFRR